MVELSRYFISVTHERGGFGLSGPRRKCREFTLTNLSAAEATEQDARDEFARCIVDFPQYKLRLYVMDKAGATHDLAVSK